MIVDWLSFTIPINETDDERVLQQKTMAGLFKLAPKLWGWLDGPIEYTGSRRPYTLGWRDNDVQFYSGTSMDNSLCELSGKVCATLRTAGLFDSVMTCAVDRTTRVDIAIDIPNADPDEIIKMGYSERFRTHSRIGSDTGVTHYVGSPKSERYARVYRYAEPHPRAGLCRIELVHRKRYAKIAAKAIVTDGAINAGLSALKAYQFQHSLVPTTGDMALPTVAIIKGDQKTLRWLIAQVSPAFRRLVANGTIENPEAFFRQYFLS